MTARAVSTSVARAAGVIAVATLLARIAGFARTLVFSGGVGSAGVGDTYQTVNMLPNIVYEVAAGGVLAAVAVPLVAGQLAVGRDREADQAASALLTWAVTVLAPLSVVLALTAPWVSRALLGASATAAETGLGARMLVLFAPQVLLYGIGIVLTGVLQARRRFLAAALAPLLSSLVVIGAYLAYAAVTGPGRSADSVPAAAVWVLAGGTTLGVVVLSLPLLVPVARAGVRLRPTLRFPTGLAPRARSLASAGVLALVSQQAAVFTTLWVTHHRTTSVGVVNVFTYVQAVYLLPYAVLAVPVATSAFPALAHSSAAEASSGFGTAARDTLARALQAIVLLTAGAAAVLMAVSAPMGSFFEALDRGAHRGGGPALAALPGALSAYAPGVVGFGVTALLTRALYVRGRPIHAALAVAAGWLLAALAPLAFVPSHAGAGTVLGILGVASTLGMTLTALLLVTLVRGAWGEQALQGSGRTLRSAVVAMALALAVGDVIARALAATSLWGSLAVGVLVAVVTATVYGAMMLVTDREGFAVVRRRSSGARKDGA
ncbi:lipid II flippase MurJ [Pedococcus sp.]|uniref:lipid II flippase MurJ n=1 Tax=Pedococcus sp. TaxID=2860345 RepID=UPI002E0E5CD1|nr:lipid II flippase MurJ [Pedococcus sp.]